MDGQTLSDRRTIRFLDDLHGRFRLRAQKILKRRERESCRATHAM